MVIRIRNIIIAAAILFVFAGSAWAGPRLVTPMIYKDTGVNFCAVVNATRTKTVEIEVIIFDGGFSSSPHETTIAVGPRRATLGPGEAINLEVEGNGFAYCTIELIKGKKGHVRGSFMYTLGLDTFAIVPAQ